MKQFSFKKKFRLLNKNQYKNVFRNSYVVRFQEILIFGHKNDRKYSRLGISISKKNIKKSYKRNYLKRIIREFFRMNKEKFFRMDFVVCIKKQFSQTNKIFLKKLEFLWFKYFLKKRK
ncbi:ribonuclease P protein component [Buchnera aphidicola]|uniref:ribonuclease P protein component n=1 Tax=Buchnera aphidicola TaxID=9 RepID=UPI003464D408